MQEEPKKMEMSIELDDKTAEGIYSNLVIISHSPTEFVLDFAALMPGIPKAKVKSRIILCPEHAKRLLLSLQENITKYESNIGRINITGGQQIADGNEEESVDELNLKGFTVVGEA